MNNSQRIHVPRRSGVVLLMALVTLAIVSAVCMSLTKTVVLRHDRHELREWRLQAELLAQSALDRTELKLAEFPEYSGEIWQPRFPDGSV